MGLALIYEDGQTPLDEDESEGLLLKTITTQGELNEAEQLNIEEAFEWTLRRKFNAATVLTEEFVCGLHKRMYGEVWRWAGEFRKSDKSIGIDKSQIPVALRSLIDDCKFWISKESFPADEIAVRFKHRIVSIHCFSNGNGRHSRLMADVIVNHIFGKPVFSWGSNNPIKEREARATYIKALKLADMGEYGRLMEFARG